MLSAVSSAVRFGVELLARLAFGNTSFAVPVPPLDVICFGLLHKVPPLVALFQLGREVLVAEAKVQSELLRQLPIVLDVSRQ